MMSRKDYEKLSAIMANGLAASHECGGEQYRTVFYENVYGPLVDMLAEDNPRFDRSRFAFAVSNLETN